MEILIHWINYRREYPTLPDEERCPICNLTNNMHAVYVHCMYNLEEEMALAAVNSSDERID